MGDWGFGQLLRVCVGGILRVRAVYGAASYPPLSLLTLASLPHNQLVFVFCFYGSINESRARFDLISL